MNAKDLQRLAAMRAASRQMGGGYRPANEPVEAFDQFSASELYCAKCRRSMPVRQKLLLALPGGDLYDYLCTGCGASVGTRTTN